MSYCDIAPGRPFHGPYHDREYGFPTRAENRLFERLVLEINQAGLSWLTVLRKRNAFRRAFDSFDVDRVAAYGGRERARLLADPGIVRNRLKVEALLRTRVGSPLCATATAASRDGSRPTIRWIRQNG